MITKLFEPKIQTKKLEIFDKTKNKVSPLDVGERKVGGTSPYISINDVAFFDDSIHFFELSINAFLPKITTTINDIGAQLQTSALILDTIISVFISSDNTDYKGIRQDYRVISCIQHGSEFTIEAILEIPDLFVDVVDGFDGSVIEYLKKIAKKLNLGFASNVSSTNDVMYHICPNISYFELINSELLAVSYIDSKSFFRCFIDQYYYMNFVEVNSLIKKEYEMVEGSQVPMGDEHGFDKERFESKIYISNNKTHGSLATYLEKHEQRNSAGLIGVFDGHRTNLMVFDKDTNTFKQVYIETTTSEGISDNDIVMKGSVDDDHTKNTRNIHIGSMFLDNIHENYYVSQVMNKNNNNEIQKASLEIELKGIEFSLTNFLQIPIEIISSDNSYTDFDDDVEENGVNRALSGMYVISNLRYCYKYGRNFMKSTMIRREYTKN
jgi:hypothetical protein